MVFSFTLVMASFSSDNSRDTPDRRKMQVTPNLPMNSSGLSIPPLTPREGKVLAKATAVAIPSKNEFFWIIFWILVNAGDNDDDELLSLLPPPVAMVFMCKAELELE